MSTDIPILCVSHDERWHRQVRQELAPVGSCTQVTPRRIAPAMETAWHVAVADGRSVAQGELAGLHHTVCRTLKKPLVLCAERTELAEFLRWLPQVQVVRQELLAGHVSQLCGSGEKALHAPAPSMGAFHLQLSRAAACDECILLLGESGSGKTRAATFIHEHSRRAGAPFLQVNMAECNENVIESFLFGTVKGAYTGALHTRGALEAADGGTLFFDEIADLPVRLQTKLLNLVETRSFRRVGSMAERTADIRFIFATNADIGERIRLRTFREDLLYRINTLTVQVPPLRDHREDIPHLAKDFARLKNKRISGGAVQKLCAYQWPGNIRQLKNTVLRASVFSASSEIQAEDISFF